jgi:hypothetical protein
VVLAFDRPLFFFVVDNLQNASLALRSSLSQRRTIFGLTSFGLRSFRLPVGGGGGWARRIARFVALGLEGCTLQGLWR